VGAGRSWATAGSGAMGGVRGIFCCRQPAGGPDREPRRGEPHKLPLETPPPRLRPAPLRLCVPSPLQRLDAAARPAPFFQTLSLMQLHTPQPSSTRASMQPRTQPLCQRTTARPMRKTASLLTTLTSASALISFLTLEMGSTWVWHERGRACGAGRPPDLPAVPAVRLRMSRRDQQCARCEPAGAGALQGRRYQGSEGAAHRGPRNGA
jgi:hypothetical protein